jgi:L-lactate utilization protein LutB
MSESEHRRWLWKKLGETCLTALKKHGFDTHWTETVEEARQCALSLSSGYETFGFGGSDTTRTLGLVEALRQEGKIVYDHWQAGLTPESDMDIRRAQGQADCFFCSANGISATGEIVNVDGIGNRTNAMTFGPRKVILVAGINKVTPDLASALARVQQIAAPMRAKSLGMKTPCAETGLCNDCNAPQRICRVTTILHRRPMRTDVSVVLVNASLGF